MSIDELREVAPRALLLGMFKGRGRDGVQVRRQTASVWTFREGLVFRVWNYEGWGQAVIAVGGYRWDEGTYSPALQNRRERPT